MTTQLCVFVWTLKDMFFLGVLGMVALLFVTAGLLWCADWFRRWLNR